MDFGEESFRPDIEWISIMPGLYSRGVTFVMTPWISLVSPSFGAGWKNKVVPEPVE